MQTKYILDTPVFIHREKYARFSLKLEYVSVDVFFKPLYCFLLLSLSINDRSAVDKRKKRGDIGPILVYLLELMYVYHNNFSKNVISYHIAYNRLGFIGLLR